MQFRALFAVAMSIALAGAAAAETKDYPFTPVPFTDVRIGDGFWLPRLETNRTVTVRYDFQKCEETGRISNFARAGGLEEGKFEGIPFNDSDVVKVVEGASYTLAMHPDPELDKYLDALIAKIAAAQEDDGYLYTARTLGFTNGMTGPQRWTNLAASHELYNVGHMYEAAVAHFLATGKRAFLEVAIKNADHLVKTFGPEPGQLIDVPGHQEIEIGLVKLYRATGEEKYLRLAKFFIDMRGRADKRKIYGEYCQDHKPLVEQEEVTGHAVRAGYLYSGVADVAALTGDEDYLRAIDRLWEDMVSRQMYLTGSVGVFEHGEGYSRPYDLPNLKAYNETCAAIANALWNHRMFLLHGEAKYIDVLERIIYNGFLSGISLSGDTFFYPNPLACDGRFRFNHGDLVRSPWFGCSCCPVNVVRFIPSIAGYVYAQRGDAVFVNLYVAGSGTVKTAAGTLRLEQQTRYPWDGKVRIVVQGEPAGLSALKLRIPGWAQGRPVPGDLYRYATPAAPPVTLTVNGQTVQLDLQDGYATIRRAWQSGDVVELDLPMPVRRVLAHENVVDDRGRVALERGPVLYCIEGADHGGRVLNLVLPDEAELSPEHRADLLGGVTVLRGTAQEAYRTEGGEVQTRPAALTMIPYYAWCHRGANEMAVWLPKTVDLAQVPLPPTLASSSRASSSYCWPPDSVAAVNDQAEPADSNDHAIPRLTWWDHKGTAEWLQYDFDRPAKVEAVEVYWFDDSGRGGCRVPESWRLLYRAGEQWKPVETQDRLGVEKDRYNLVRFAPLTAAGLRIELQLQPQFSGGVLEWKVR
ncbi:MAG: glycoside hydrolase family 127 protein [Pirellulaceae bacterium]|jgi:hypothetical protein|nr:glycoside hydrolase family 127 protein [Pirellulaceae bacterium]